MTGQLAVRPSRIVFTWQAPGWSGATEVEVTFAGDDRFTRVEVEHRGWDDLGPDGPAEVEGFRNGWPAVLDAYATVASASAG